MILYVDTSIVLRVLFGEPGQLPVWGAWERAYASEIMGVEAGRAIDRARLDGSLDDEGVAAAQLELSRIERSLGMVRLTREVLDRASLPMATSVRTLDGLHLASALLYREARREDLVFATHDRRQGLAARALGFEVAGSSLR